MAFGGGARGAGGEEERTDEGDGKKISLNEFEKTCTEFAELMWEIAGDMREHPQRWEKLRQRSSSMLLISSLHIQITELRKVLELIQQIGENQEEGREGKKERSGV